MQQLRIISRNSQLALWQATHVKEQLLAKYADLAVSIIGISTKGDRILDQSLEKIGGKGLFIKELEQQLLLNQADLAVHSLKDLPANLTTEFQLAAILTREDPRDVLVSNHYSSLDLIPKGGVIGTSSARRSAILQEFYPHLTVSLLRGNLQTRLAKLDAGEYSAIILAAAGLKRLGLSARITQILDPKQFIPAIGQGALALEIKQGQHELLTKLEVLNDHATFACVAAEREMGRFLNASCNLPIAGHATISGDILQLNSFFADVLNNKLLYAHASGPVDEYLSIGRSCAQELLAQGISQTINFLNTR